MPPLKSCTFSSHISQPTNQSLQKSMPFEPHIHSNTADKQTTKDRRAACNNQFGVMAAIGSNSTVVLLSTLVHTLG